jgi:hypothetical protein
MIELEQTLLQVDVQASEYHRLLGYPRDHELSDRARELADAARAWYARYGKPSIYTCEVNALEYDGASIVLEGVRFSSTRLSHMFRDAAAHSAVFAAVSAGPELERESQKLWSEEKPDEYFFLEMFGSAVVEQLTTMAGARICGWAESRQMAVLPHYSPGYPEWDIAEQPALLRLMRQRGLTQQIESLDSGALRPRKSLLAVFGITRQAGSIRPLSELVACQSCSFAPCQYRRAAYLPPLPPHQVNVKALKRWADERLVLHACGDGTWEASFRYEGTTCTNMGRPLAFDYRVRLGRREEGYPIREQRCAPVADDTGHMMMCRYLDQRDRLMSAIAEEKPLAGRPLHEVLTWARPVCAAGCYCEADARQHKWGLVLETIQYALARREGRE